MSCKHSVPLGGRHVTMRQCQRAAGFGPNGAYCKQHAPLHESVTPKMQLWQVKRRWFNLDSPQPVVFKVREIRGAYYIDVNGRRCKLEDQWHSCFPTRAEALRVTRDRIAEMLSAARRTETEAMRALKLIVPALQKELRRVK